MHPFPTPLCAGLDGNVRWNPADKNATVTLSNLDRTMTADATTNGQGVRTRVITAGSWYWECVMFVGPSSVGLGPGIGQASVPLNADPSQSPVAWQYQVDGNVTNNNAAVATFPTYATGDIIGLAFHTGVSKIWFSKNGVWQGGGDPSTGVGGIAVTAGTYYAHVFAVSSMSWVLQKPLNYAKPTGFRAL